MSGVLRQGLLIGAGIVLVDWITGTMLRAVPCDDPTQGTIAAFGLGANVALFWIGGYLGFRESAEVRGGAEVGVLAGVMAALAGAATLLLSPSPCEPPPGSIDLVRLLALNIALGGMTSLAGAWFARMRQPRA